MTFSREGMFYNALAIQLQSHHQKLSTLYQHHGSWENAWIHSRSLFPLDPETELARLTSLNISIVLRDEATFPSLLREIPFPPHAVYVRGTIPDTTTKQVAIVGTRKPTDEGKELATTISATLAAHGVIIISGLAYGIDAAAHHGALEGGGKTIAVLAHGLHTTHPATHATLADRILESNGCLISEYPVGTPALKYQFIARNRIISGLSNGVVIIEAPQRSGSLSTARFAYEQDRSLMVTPGPANHPQFRGSHNLLRLGALLVENALQIGEELGITLNQPSLETQPSHAVDPSEAIILNVLAKTIHPVTIDKISEVTNLKIQTVLHIVTRLILTHKIQETINGISLL